ERGTRQDRDGLAAREEVGVKALTASWARWDALLHWGISRHLGLFAGRTYLRPRPLVTRAAARFSYAQPQRRRLARDWRPICKGQRLGLRFPHGSAEFFSLVIKAQTWISRT